MVHAAVWSFEACDDKLGTGGWVERTLSTIEGSEARLWSLFRVGLNTERRRDSDDAFRKEANYDYTSQT